MDALNQPAAQAAAAPAFPPPARGWLLPAVPVFAIALAFAIRLGMGEGLYQLALNYGRLVDYLSWQSWLVGQVQAHKIAIEIYVYFLLLIAMLVLIPKQGGQSLSVYLKRVRPTWMVGGVVAGILCAFAIITTQIILVERHVVVFHATKAERMLAPDSASELPLALFLAAICAPVIEELYFRGLLLGWLRRRLHVAIAVLISAILFALTHGYYVSHPGLEGWIITAMIGVVGLVVSVMALASRSLWPSMATHFGYNGTLLLLPFIARAMAH